jgi:hypothetical protein
MFYFVRITARPSLVAINPLPSRTGSAPFLQWHSTCLVRVLSARAIGRYTDLHLAQIPASHLHRADCEPSDLLTDRQSEGRLTDYSGSCIASGWIWMAATSSLIAVINCELASLVQRPCLTLRQIHCYPVPMHCGTFHEASSSYAYLHSSSTLDYTLVHFYTYSQLPVPQEPLRLLRVVNSLQALKTHIGSSLSPSYLNLASSF